MKRLILIVVVLSAMGIPASAQRWSVSTNAVDYVNFGTLNIEGSASVAQHFTVFTGTRFNPWTINDGEENQKQNRQMTMYAGTRYWPWHIYSGWWTGIKTQYQVYNHGGILKQETEEGDAVGAGIGAGYTLMLNRHFNLELGGYIWGGYKYDYTVYSCPRCGRIIENGSKWFAAPDDVILSLVYIF